MRASRLLSLLLLLQTRGRMTAPELAAELEVSVRTVYRDVESLSSAGVPVYADRGPAGGYRLLDGYRTKLTGLSSDEAVSLFLAGLPGPAAELGMGAVLAGAQLKLLAALPAESRERAAAMREVFHLDAPGWFRDPEPIPYLSEIGDAVWTRKRLRVRYRSWRRGEQWTVLDPLGMVLKAGLWYLVARAGDKIRTYRVTRVGAVEPLDEGFTRPEDFDLAKFWQEWTERFERESYTAEAVIRVSPEGRARAVHLTAPAVRRAIEESAGEPDAGGWVRATVPIESIRHAVADLLKLGPDLEVLEPPELRAAVTDRIAALARLYGG